MDASRQTTGKAVMFSEKEKLHVQGDLKQKIQFRKACPFGGRLLLLKERVKYKAKIKEVRYNLPVCVWCIY